MEQLKQHTGWKQIITLVVNCTVLETIQSTTIFRYFSLFLTYKNTWENGYSNYHSKKNNSNNLMYFELCISYTEGQDNQQTKHEFEVEAVLHQKEK